MTAAHAGPWTHLLLDDDDVAVLVWLGLPFDAEPVEVLRALVHVVIDDCRSKGSQDVDPQVGIAIKRLRAKTSAAR